jgi:hypothetical protein
VGILLVIALESIVRYHQRQHYNQLSVEKPRTGIIFPEVKRVDADKGITECLKFFSNYFFYKYGLEVSGIEILLSKVTHHHPTCSLLTRADIQAVFCYFHWQICGTDSVPHQ